MFPVALSTRITRPRPRSASNMPATEPARFRHRSTTTRPSRGDDASAGIDITVARIRRTERDQRLVARPPADFAGRAAATPAADRPATARQNSTSWSISDPSRERGRARDTRTPCRAGRGPRGRHRGPAALSLPRAANGSFSSTAARGVHWRCAGCWHRRCPRSRAPRAWWPPRRPSPATRCPRPTAAPCLPASLLGHLMGEVADEPLGAVLEQRGDQRVLGREVPVEGVVGETRPRRRCRPPAAARWCHAVG